MRAVRRPVPGELRFFIERGDPIYSTTAEGRIPVTWTFSSELVCTDAITAIYKFHGIVKPCSYPTRLAMYQVETTGHREVAVLASKPALEE